MIRTAAAFVLLGAVALAGDTFPVFVWCQDHAGTALASPLLEPFGGVNIEGADKAEWALEHDIEFYVGHAPGREVLHLQRDVPWYDAMWKKFYETRDTSLLIREPCLTDPATWKAASAQLDRTLAARGREHGRALSLGDEVGLTPWGDPLDLCQSSHCTQRWTEWLEQRGYVFEDEQLAPWPTTDAVRLAYLDGEATTVHDWLDRRRFHQDVVLEFLAGLAQHVRHREPDLPLALFGLTGQTAFGGVSIPRVLPLLDVLEAYSEGNARELLYSLREQQESWCTLFPAEGDSDRGAHRLWEHWLRGGDGAIIWSDRELKRNPQYLARLAKAVREVRAVHARFPGWRPQPAGVALLHDSDSTALAWLRDALGDGPTWPRRFAGYQAEHGTRESAVNDSLRLFEDSGVLPGAVPLELVGATTASRFPLLAAVHQLVLTESDEQKLADYLEAGGKLLLRGAFGLLGDRESQDSRQAEARLTKRFPGRVLRFKIDEAGEFDYLGARIHARDGRVAGLRKEFTALSGQAREWTLQCKPPIPMLIAQQLLADGSLLCAVIPNLPDGPLPRVEIELGTELAAERVFPIEEQPESPLRVHLAPGDAFVFLLREK